MLKLVSPSKSLEAPFLEMVNGWGIEKSTRFNEAFNDFEWYVDCLLSYEKGQNLPLGWVPYSTFWLMENDHKIIGTGRFRHRLNPFLKNFGGHIGYDVAPFFRRKGYGSKLFSLLLEKAKQRCLHTALLTCDRFNTGSIRIILKNGGEKTNEIVRNDGVTYRYHIVL